MRRTVCSILIILISISLLSCVSPHNDSKEGYTFVDDLGREVTISESDKIAAAHASFADCWLLSGGKLVGMTSDAVEDHGIPQENAAIIGSAKTINKEALVASGATVVLMSADLVAHLELENSLESIGIKCVFFKVDTFDDYSRVMGHMTNITGRDDLYTQHVTSVGERIDAILERIPQNEDRTLLLMRVYSSGIKAKSNDNIAGLILNEFGLKNIADDHPSLLEDMSLEHIIETNPNVIFVLTMGNEEAAISYLHDKIESNKAFASLQAVKGGGYHILPKDLFHYKPNERWDESYEYLAKLLYGEIFN